VLRGRGRSAAAPTVGWGGVEGTVGRGQGWGGTRYCWGKNADSCWVSHRWTSACSAAILSTPLNPSTTTPAGVEQRTRSTSTCAAGGTVTSAPSWPPVRSTTSARQRAFCKCVRNAVPRPRPACAPSTRPWVRIGCALWGEGRLLVHVGCKGKRCCWGHD